MKLRRLVPPLGLVQKRFVRKRREKRSRRRFEDDLDKLRERKGQFDHWNHSWAKGHDANARRKAQECLEEMRKIIRRLASNNHRRKLEDELRALQIPGATKILKEAANARRR